MIVPDEARRAIEAHARFEYPNEACGLVAAFAGELRMVYCLTNTRRSRFGYTLDPTEHFRATRHAERNGWEIVGVFHSHVSTGAFPSPTDVSQAPDSEWLYLIVSLADADHPDLRGFWIRDGRVIEETLTVRPGGGRRRAEHSA